MSTIKLRLLSVPRKPTMIWRSRSLYATYELTPVRRVVMNAVAFVSATCCRRHDSGGQFHRRITSGSQKAAEANSM